MAWHSHVDISDGEVEPALVVAAGGDGVELPASPPECCRVVGDDGAAPAPVGRLEVAGHVTGEREAAAQRDGLLGLPEDHPGRAGEVHHGCQHNMLVAAGASQPSQTSQTISDYKFLVCMQKSLKVSMKIDYIKIFAQNRTVAVAVGWSLPSLSQETWKSLAGAAQDVGWLNKFLCIT